jgi:hypothetical protein
MRLPSVLLLLLLSGSCEDNTPQCIPSVVAPCSCYTGGPGEKTCSADGLEFGKCVCTPDAGVSADADVDASATEP